METNGESTKRSSENGYWLFTLSFAGLALLNLVLTVPSILDYWPSAQRVVPGLTDTAVFVGFVLALLWRARNRRDWFRSARIRSIVLLFIRINLSLCVIRFLAADIARIPWRLEYYVGDFWPTQVSIIFYIYLFLIFLAHVFCPGIFRASPKVWEQPALTNRKPLAETPPDGCAAPLK